MEQYKRIEKILIAAGITSRKELDNFDWHHGIEGLKGIGPKRRELIHRVLLNHSPAWEKAFPNIPLTAPTLPVELSPVQGARVEWQPSDALLEGAGGMAVDVPDEA